MKLTSEIFIGLVALEAFYILYIEMFAWTTKGPKIFRGFPKDLFVPTKALAANQGLYNGFLGGGLSLVFIDNRCPLECQCSLLFLRLYNCGRDLWSIDGSKIHFFYPSHACNYCFDFYVVEVEEGDRSKEDRRK